MISMNQFRSRLSRQSGAIKTASQGITLVLVGASAWMLGKMVWFEQANTTTPSSWKPSNVSAPVATAPTYNVGKIVSMNLFGKYNNKPEEKRVTPVVSEVPKTTLNVKLVGVVASSNTKLSVAVMSYQGKQNIYGVGEAIDNTRATIANIFADRVIIRNQGRDETVMLDGQEYQKPPAVNSRQSPKKTKTDQKSEPAANVAAIKKAILSNPQTLFTYIRLSQVKKDGQLMGYRVNPGKDRALFDSIGLKPNDLAVSLNGKDLTDPAVMASLWSELSSISAFSLTVERDGQLHQVDIDL